MVLHGSGNGFHCLGILPKGNPSLFYIGAGNIDLQKIYRLVSQPLCHLKIIFLGSSAHIDNNPGIILPQKRNIPLHKYIDSRVLQADGIQHSSINLRNPGSRIALPGHICHTFCDHCAKSV